MVSRTGAKCPYVKITRTSKCSLKFATPAKRAELVRVLEEYGRITNIFIERFWAMETLPRKNDCGKPMYDSVDSWLSAVLRMCAAREALDMVSGSRERDGDKAVMPTHRGRSMHVFGQTCELQPAKGADEFDCWLRMKGLAKGLGMYLPIKFHKHFNRMSAKGTLLNSFIVKSDEVVFAFQIETGEKRSGPNAIGVDTGINALATLDDGRQLGADIKALVERIKRRQHGSKGQQRARRALKHRMDEVAKQVARLPQVDLVVVEALKGLSHGTKQRRRLCKNMRRSLAAWAWRYWLERLKLACERYRVSFRSVPPQYTSQTCHACGHCERGNRAGEEFLCRKCGHADNADANGAKNILQRFLVGPYRADYKELRLNLSSASSRLLLEACG